MPNPGHRSITVPHTAAKWLRERHGGDRKDEYGRSVGLSPWFDWLVNRALEKEGY